MFSIFFFLLCIQLEHQVQRFILLILLKNSSGHKKHQQAAFHCAHSQKSKGHRHIYLCRTGQTLSRNAIWWFYFHPLVWKLCFYFTTNLLALPFSSVKGLLFLLFSTLGFFPQPGLTLSVDLIAIVLQSRHSDNVSSRVLGGLWPVISFGGGYWRCWDAYYCCSHIRLFTVQFNTLFHFGV